MYVKNRLARYSHAGKEELAFIVDKSIQPINYDQLSFSRLA